MKHLLPALSSLLLLAASSSFATTYKCKLPDGQTTYQTEPCRMGKQVLLNIPDKQDAPRSIEPTVAPTTNPKPTHAENGPAPTEAQRDAWPLTYRGRSQPVSMTIGNIAGSYGRGTQIDPAIKDVGDFDYRGVDFKLALSDIAARFNLVVDIGPKLVVVKRR